MADDVTNEQILDDVESAILRSLPIGLREKVLDAVWQVLTDNRADQKDEEQS
jgi:hypothetical protein